MIEREKRRSRLSVADVLLILLACLALLSVAGYVYHRRTVTDGEREIACVMRVSSVERSFLEAHGEELIPVGSVVRNENGTAELGRVEAVTVTEHMRAVLRDGEVVWEADAAYADVELTVRMRGLEKGSDGLRVKDLRIAAGGRGNFRIGNYYAAGAKILSVEVIAGI